MRNQELNPEHDQEQRPELEKAPAGIFGKRAEIGEEDQGAGKDEQDRKDDAMRTPAGRDHHVVPFVGPGIKSSSGITTQSSTYTSRPAPAVTANTTNSSRISRVSTPK